MTPSRSTARAWGGYCIAADRHARERGRHEALALGLVPAALVLVHGLWHGAWSWDLVRTRLAGAECIAVDLPMTALEDDVAAVRQVLDTLPGPVVLAAHSYGGAVITAAGEHPAVRALVYLAAFQLAPGESISRAVPEAELAPTALAEALRFSPDRSEVSIDPELGRTLLYGKADPATADAQLARTRPVARSLFSATVTTSAWQHRASTYVVCSEDRCVSPDLQRAMAARATRSLEWACDHTPLISAADRVARLLAEQAREQGRAREDR